MLVQRAMAITRRREKIVDLPAPDGPTRALQDPLFNLKLRSLIVGESGFEG